MSDIYDKLKADFTPDAFSEDKSRGFALTSIKAQYVVERLNDVFGVDGWSATYDFSRPDGKEVLSICTLNVIIGDKQVSRVAVGASQAKKQLGDTYKSAMTDSLGKAASHFGVGNDVFKGLVNPDGSKKGSKPKTKATTKASSFPASTGKIEKAPETQSSFNPANVKAAESKTPAKSNPFA